MNSGRGIRKGGGGASARRRRLGRPGHIADILLWHRGPVLTSRELAWNSGQIYGHGSTGHARGSGQLLGAPCAAA